MGSVDGVAELETNIEYEDWLPSVINKWNAFQESENPAKQYTAFLRFVFKAYGIDARAHIRWMNPTRRRSNKYRVLQVQYDGRTRTMDEMREMFEEVWEIISAFPPPTGLEYECNIKYTSSQIWEQRPSNGPVYVRMAMCVGKGAMPYMPPEIREAILSS